MQDLQARLRNYSHGLYERDTYTKYGILVPILEIDGECCLVFEKRASSLRRQPGEICFPGGKAEPSDASLWDTASREAGEELRISRDAVRYVQALDYLVTYSRMMIYPYVGVLDVAEPILPNPAEVQELLVVNLERLRSIQPELHYVDLRVEPSPEFPLAWIPDGADYRWRGGKVTQPFYQVDGRIIWGLTARILQQFLQVLE